MHEKEIVKWLSDVLATWAVWAFWWIANHLYQISKWEKFRWGMFLINAFLAFWVATIVWDFIPANAAYRDGIIWMSWFSSFPILKLVEQQFPKYILSKMWIWKDVKQ